MGDVRRSLVLATLLLLVAVGAWWLLSGRDDRAADLELDDAQEREEASLPILVGRGEEPSATESSDPPANDRVPPTRDTDWVIEINDIRGPDGQAIAEADVTIEVPGPPPRKGWSTEARDWTGSPLLVRAIRAVSVDIFDLTQADEVARALEWPTFDPKREAYATVYAEGHAPRIVSLGRRPADGHTRASITLAPLRSFDLRLRNQHGGESFEGEVRFEVRAPGLFDEDVGCDVTQLDDDTYRFGPEDLPSGPLILTASSDRPVADGWRTSLEIASHETSVDLQLEPAYEFRFDVSVEERSDAPNLGARSVDIRPLTTSEADRPVRPAIYELSSSGGRGDPRVVVLPPGRVERWRVSCEGYVPVEVDLVPSGPERKRVLPIRLRPDRATALLIVDVHLAEHLQGARLNGSVISPDRPSASMTKANGRAWIVPSVPRGKPLVAAYRVAAHRDQTLRLWIPGEERHPEGWVFPPVDARVQPGVDRRVSVAPVAGGTLVVTRRLEGSAESPRIEVEGRLGTIWVHGWRPGSHENGNGAWVIKRRLPPGRWRVSSAHEGRPTGWQTTVDIEARKTTWVQMVEPRGAK